MKGGDGGVGLDQVHLLWPVGGDGLVGADGVVFEAVVIEVVLQVEGVVDLFAVQQPRVFQGAESAVAPSRSGQVTSAGCARGAVRGGWR